MIRYVLISKEIKHFLYLSLRSSNLGRICEHRWMNSQLITTMVFTYFLCEQCVKEVGKEDFKRSGWDQYNCPKTYIRSSFPQSLKLTYIDLYETFIKTVSILMILSIRQQMINYTVFNASKDSTTCISVW